MVQQAEAHAAEDRQRREQIDAKNMADSSAYQAEKQLKDLGDKTRAESLIRELREAINQENYHQMKSLSNDLQQAMMQIGSAVYSQAETNSSGGSSNGSSSDDVIDADFVESK